MKELYRFMYKEKGYDSYYLVTGHLKKSRRDYNNFIVVERKSISKYQYYKDKEISHFIIYPSNIRNGMLHNIAHEYIINEISTNPYCKIC